MAVAKAKRNGGAAAHWQLRANRQSARDAGRSVGRVDFEILQVGREIVLARVTGRQQRRRWVGCQRGVDAGILVPCLGNAARNLAEITCAALADSRRVAQE